MPFFRPPTLAQIRANDLEEARRYLRDHLAKAEYHDAMVKMITTRIARLEKESQPELAPDRDHTPVTGVAFLQGA